MDKTDWGSAAATDPGLVKPPADNSTAAESAAMRAMRDTAKDIRFPPLAAAPKHDRRHLWPPDARCAKALACQPDNVAGATVWRVLQARDERPRLDPRHDNGAGRACHRPQ